MQTNFADMIGNIRISGGIVRMDLLEINGMDPKTKKPIFEVSEKLAMPIDGFLRSLDSAQKIKEQLVKDGVIKIKQT